MPAYEIFALRYAAMPERTVGQSFLFPDRHDAPWPMDFFLWAIRGEGRVIVVDTGFSAASGAERGRATLHAVPAMLGRIGIDAAQVPDVVMTHLHWDHAGNMDLFGRASFHLQDSEMQFCTGRCMCHPLLRRTFALEDVLAMVRLVYGGRVLFHDGNAEIAPGITLHRLGGHTGGMQAVRVPTARGHVVLASDGAHFWANLESGNPFPILVDVAEMLEGFRLLTALADSPDHIIPGHDPAVLRRFPPVAGVPDTVRLDLPPLC